MGSSLEDYSTKMDTQLLDQVCSDDSDASISKEKQRRSLIYMEQSLLVPCDQNPITPESLKRNELARDGTSMERLLLERLLLRKELRLRSMHTTLIDQEARLHQQEDRIRELEERLADIVQSPGFNAFFTFSVCCKQTVSGTSRSFNMLHSGFRFTIAILYQALFYIFDLIPPFVSLGLAELLQRAGNMLALRAENQSNERSERHALDQQLKQREAENEKRGHHDRRRFSRIERRRR